MGFRYARDVLVLETRGVQGLVCFGDRGWMDPRSHVIFFESSIAGGCAGY